MSLDELRSRVGEDVSDAFQLEVDYALLHPLQRNRRRPLSRRDNTSVVAALEKRVPEIEKLHAERLLQLAQRYSKEEKDRLLVN